MKPILVSPVKSLYLKTLNLLKWRVCIFLKTVLINCIFTLPDKLTFMLSDRIVVSNKKIMQFERLNRLYQFEGLNRLFK